MTTTSPEPATADPGLRRSSPVPHRARGAAAIDFYAGPSAPSRTSASSVTTAASATPRSRIGAARIMLADEYPEIDVRSPQTLGGSAVAAAPHRRRLRRDVRTRRRRRRRRACARPEDQPHGNRMAVVRDPFGHRWILLQPHRDVRPRHLRRAVGIGRVRRASPGPDGDDAPTGRGRRSTASGPALHYRDAPRRRSASLVDVLGFEEQIVVADEDGTIGGAPLRAALARGRHRPDRHVRPRGQPRTRRQPGMRDALRHHARPRVGAGALRGRRCGDRRPAASRSTTACRVTGCSRCATARAACGASAPTAPSGDPARNHQDASLDPRGDGEGRINGSDGQAAFSIFGV